MTARAYVIAILAVALGASGCGQILGFTETSVEDTGSADAGDNGSADAPSGACVPAECQFGCDPNTNACRDGKLWIFKTTGAFLGNAFGGTDNPVNVRGGADGKCLVTYASQHQALECNEANVHAVLHVSGSDSLALMATMFSIPTNVPVHRAEDDVLVSNNWNDLTDPTKELRAPATTAPDDDSGVVWTGANTVATCVNWTSIVSTDSGTRGFTNRTEVTWLRQDTFRCDRVAALLCVCWSGGE